MRARPLRQARGWGYQRLSALGTILIVDAAPPPAQKVAGHGCASTLAFELSDGGQRLVVNCGGPGGLPTDLSPALVEGLRTTAAHSTLVLSDTNSTNIQPDGSLGKGVEDVSIDRSEDNDSSRIEAAHDGYVRAFGLIHKRSLMLGNDGKELRGAELITPGAARKIRRSVPSRRPFHLAWRRSDGHRRRHGRDPALQGRAAVEFPLPAAALLTTEESLVIDGAG